MNESLYLQLEQKLLEKIKSGDSQAMMDLADLYYRGVSSNERNYKKSFPYYKMAADNGEAVAMTKTGVALINGVAGVKQNIEEGISYLYKAAEKKEPGSLHYLGLLHERGSYLPKDEEKALYYYHQAASLGYPYAQFSLGYLKLTGSHRESDWLHWICLAHLNEDSDATEFLDNCIKQDGQMAEIIQDEIECIKKQNN